MKAKNIKTGEIVTNFEVSREYGTISYINSKGILKFDDCLSEWQILEENSFQKEEIRARIATEIYTRGLINPDGTITVVGVEDAVKHTDSLLKELYKNK